ncbi:MAG TPA: hypothetical protein VF136_01290 [Methylomirabilota bacterium]
MAARESWSTRWYTPLLALAGLLLGLIVLALAFIQVLTAERSDSAASSQWAAPLGRMDEALTRGDSAGALAAWRQAYGAAFRSTRWEGMMAVGDAASRLGADGRAQSRQAYFTALLRAEREGSLEGLLVVATAFGHLGDRDVLAHALRLAEREAGRDPVKHARVRNIADRWMSPPLEVEHRDSTLSGGHHP